MAPAIITSSPAVNVAVLASTVLLTKTSPFASAVTSSSAVTAPSTRMPLAAVKPTVPASTEVTVSPLSLVASFIVSAPSLTVLNSLPTRTVCRVIVSESSPELFVIPFSHAFFAVASIGALPLFRIRSTLSEEPTFPFSACSAICVPASRYASATRAEIMCPSVDCSAISLFAVIAAL